MDTNRRERRGSSLKKIASSNPNTAKGWAASRGVWLPSAMAVGRSSNQRLRIPPTERCTADEICDNPRFNGTVWCYKHCVRASKLGVIPPAV
jgi:hypothetical protein